MLVLACNVERCCIFAYRRDFYCQTRRYLSWFNFQQGQALLPLPKRSDRLWDTPSLVLCGYQQIFTRDRD
jgi:hypothetical protein